VAGVRGSLVATSDGLVVAHDIPDVEPTQIAALAAATLAVARRATLAT
jgi:predicted regulator of Ras-like GTPase activity (Roadblock/LC7/MglB family)